MIVCIISFYFALNIKLISLTPIHPPLGLISLATTRDSVGCTCSPTPPVYSCWVCTSPRPISIGSAIPYSYSGIQ